MALAEDHDVVQALATNRTVHPLDVRVLPRLAWCRDDLSYSHRCYPLAEGRTVRSIAVAQQKAWRCVPRERFNYLLRKPRCRRMLRNIEPHNLSATVTNDSLAALPARSERDDVWRRRG